MTPPADTPGLGAPGDPAGPSREELEFAIIGCAVALVSGPGGLASVLRQGLLCPRLAGPSLPLDVGYSDHVPAGIRNAVRARDQHCPARAG